MSFSEEQIRAIRRISREETHIILEEDVYPVIIDLANADEAKAVNIKKQITRLVEVVKPKPETDQSPDQQEILWTSQTGTKGEYEKSEDQENPRFKALLTTLQAHQGKMTVDGYFLWIFPDGQTIGRKRK